MLNILCRLGFHKLSEVIEDFVRSTGNYKMFSEWVLQRGVRKCTRPGCYFEKKVWCEGWMDSKPELSRWRKMSPKKEAEINSLQYRQLMG